MLSRRIVLGVCGGALILAAGVLLQSGHSADQPAASGKEATGDPKAAPKLVSEQTLGGPDRYLTHVSTDKPIYRAGEKVYVRAVVLHARTHAPLPAQQNLTATAEVLGPKGDVVSTTGTSTADSVLGFVWEVPADQPGGEYTVKVTHSQTGYAPAERKFDIRAYRAPRLKSQIVFVRDGYGPGDLVAATLRTERAEGGAPTGAKVTVQARVDGETVHESVAAVDPNGLASARFELPKVVARGEGTLAFLIEDGGVVETASKTIPILLQTLDLTLSPEGGELVAGLPNRIYLSALTPAQKPADLRGAIVDERGTEVATIRTEHEGRGRATYTPRAGGTYTLKIVEPAGIRTTYPLPEVKAAGVVLSAAGDVVAAGKPVAVRVGSTASGKVTVQLRQREAELASQTVSVKAGAVADVSLDAGTADGVLTVTVWQDERPVAERLIFRQPKDGVNVEIRADKASYTPGSPAKLTVKTTDSAGRPISALVGVTVADDSVLEMIEKREQAPRLPVMVLLENEVKDLADAHVYLDSQNEKAPLAVDLLLGTQGWRRFALVEYEKFVAAHGDAARRVAALKIVTAIEQSKVQAFRGGGVPRLAAAFAPQEGADKPGDAKNAPLQEAPADDRKPQAQAAQAGDPGRQKEALDKDANGLRQIVGEQIKQDAARKRIAGRDRRGDFDNFGDFAWVVVREFAHQARPDRKPGDRVDFAETLYWNAGVRTDEKTGEAQVAFAMSDSVRRTACSPTRSRRRGRSGRERSRSSRSSHSMSSRSCHSK